MTIRHPFRISGAILVTLLLTLFVVPTASVQAGTGLSIQPIKISQTLKANESTAGQILLSNASADDVAIDITVQDFIPTAGADTFQFVGRAPGVTTVRDWINIGSPLHFEFKQGESRQIPYTIKAPPNAEPGSHFGVIFFKATRVADLNAQVKVGTQVGVLTFITVPGKFEQKGAITEFKTDPFVQGGPIGFDLKFENTGTVHFEPKGTIDITSMFGSKVGSVPIEGYAVLPTGIKNMHFSWNVSGLLLGKYKATASILDIDGNLLSRSSANFYAVPLWYILGFIVTVIVLFLVIRFLRKNISISIKK